MITLRTRPRGGIVAPVGLCTLVIALLPATTGRQDLSALFSSQAAAAVEPSPSLTSATIDPAANRFAQPAGTATPPSASYRLASLDPETLHMTAAVPLNGDTGKPLAAANTVVFPIVNRRLKGDLLLPPRPRGSEAPSPGVRTREAHAAVGPILESTVMTEPYLLTDDIEANGSPDERQRYPGQFSAETIASGAAPFIRTSATGEALPELGAAELSDSHNPAMDTARLYFGIDWLDAPPSVLDGPAGESQETIPLPARRPANSGETIARKGEITGEQSLSPAARLGLTRKVRAKSEKCLAEAVYFESRGESVRGQIAVAQVVMNRVFSEFYPDNVCDVVYQNAHRRLACQFTFACDGIREVVRDADAWRRAKRIAGDTLDGKLWLEDVGKATHYHAAWVRPWWIRSMRKLDKIGMHTFYRPRRWGSGADEPMWGDAKVTAALTKVL